jgi:hypothetical protein
MPMLVEATMTSRFERHPRLTPMRAFALLETINDVQGSNEWKLRRVREALSSHVRAALTVAQKRRHRRGTR